MKLSSLNLAKQYLKKHGESAALLEDPSWVSTKADKGKCPLYPAFVCPQLFRPAGVPRVGDVAVQKGNRR
jgi:hypothetical protein